MKSSSLALSCLVLAGWGFSVHAADIRHTFAGDDRNSFYIDDAGGSVDNGGNDLSYYLNLRDVDQSAIGTLFLFADDGVAEPTVDNGFAGHGVAGDFTGGSGIQLFELSSLPLTTAAGEVGLAGNAPPTPVSYQGDVSGLTVEQVSYTSDAAGDRFVIVEYRVINGSSGTVQARIGLSNDFDVDLKSADALVGYDASQLPTVFQQEQGPLDPSHTTVGVSLLRGALAQYRLESCSGAFGSCEILDGGDTVRSAFFQGASGQVGNLTAGVPDQDFAVTIAANLGSIPPGESRGAVFCYNAANGADPDEGLANCLSTALDCETFYENEVQICGNGLVNFNETCDDGDSDLNDSCPDGPSGSCEPASCGDGFTWDSDGGDETCDDGNANDNDACPSGALGTCDDATCGDGIVWNTDGGTEACDDGNADNTDACCNCQPARCGDGFLWAGNESCDDGNDNTSDACPSGPTGTCEPARCGDGHVQTGVEFCDDGDNDTNDACPSGPGGSCQAASCGDGFVQTGVEVCDTAISGSACVDNCTQFDSCGDGNLDPGEACDDGDNITSDACPSGDSGTCQNARCGDGFVRVGVEGCDDGNTDDGDGCPSDCEVGAGPGPSPDPGTGPSPDPGVVQTCGNGIKEGTELCDDGNENENDLCSSECFPLPVLQGGGTSSNSPLRAGGCSLQVGERG